MPLPAAVPVMLTAAERTSLKNRVRGAKTPWRDRLRAQIVLDAARGRDNARIAADLGISVDTARRWRGRFAARRMDGLNDLPDPRGRGGSARRSGPRWSRWPDAAGFPKSGPWGSSGVQAAERKRLPA